VIVIVHQIKGSNSDIPEKGSFFKESNKEQTIIFIVVCPQLIPVTGKAVCNQKNKRTGIYLLRIKDCREGVV